MKIIATTFLIFLAGCTHLAVDTNSVYFPQMPPPQPGHEEILLTAGGSGYLVIDRGCVRLRSDTDHKISTILWHRGFQLVKNGKSVAIKSIRTGKLYPIGTHVEIGGGAMSQEAAERIDPVAARQCGPLFGSGWIAE